MPKQQNEIVIIGDCTPGLYLAAAFAFNGQNATLLKSKNTRQRKIELFLNKIIPKSQLDLISIEALDSFEKKLKGNWVIDNFSWLEDEWWQELQLNHNDEVAGWISLVPSRINKYKFNDNFCGLIFYPDFQHYPLAEVIAEMPSKVSSKVQSWLNQWGCYLLETREDRKFISLAVGLQFHYLAIFQAQINKINPSETEHLLGKAAGFLPQGILSSLQQNPYLKLLHQHPEQLNLVLSGYQYVANLKDDQLLKHLPKFKPRKRLTEIEHVKKIPDFDERAKSLLLLDNRLSRYYQRFFLQVFQWASYTVKDFPLSADNLDAIYKYAWGWPRGPFELWNKWQPDHVMQDMEQLELAPAGWVFRLNQSVRHFYRWEASGKKILDEKNWHYLPASLPEHLSDFKPDRILWHKPEATITDVGDNILNLEFHSKLNMIDQDVMEGMGEVLNIASREGYEGVVISNNGPHFTVGVNLGLVFFSAIEKDYEYIQFMIESFQQRMIQLKYAAVPVVMACHGYTIGGGTEMLLHLSDRVVTHQVTRIGLVETNAGLIPGGGGSKEMSIRAASALSNENWSHFLRIFENIASGEINQNALQAKENGVLHGNSPVIKNRDWLLHEAKKLVRQKSSEYQPAKPPKIQVAGRAGIERLEKYIMDNRKFMKWSGKKIKLLKKAAYVFCGGNVEPNSLLTEQSLLDLEKEYFLKLCGERYTLQRINQILRGK